MTGQDNRQENLQEEMKKLGNNFKKLFSNMITPETKEKVISETKKALDEVTNAFDEVVEDFSKSEIYAQMKTELEDLQHRIHSGEVGEAIERDLSKIMNTINSEMEKATNKESQNE
jgi:DNA-binding transcriptional regulator GbsR (MarR family)